MAIILVAIGSNRCHGRHGRPAGVVRAAIAALPNVVSVSPIIATAPLGPGTRRYANAVVALDWPGSLPALLAELKAMEKGFGRRRRRRWGDRVLDLDIIAAGDAVVTTRTLTVPHPELARRRFVLDPLLAVAPAWRHPVSGLTARQLRARLLRPKAAALPSSLPAMGP
ncbi:2-amino-4-hydroxy-6-hydroxymethyldihydropteridine diphosphokinase [Sandarakinorhabdus rubra]|uniref:2-amino-4-hydroxy-6- hydroxymethyldihydropteridine diphosphokinase n=1 Tax=Sandarakinorhabdus rubra TaxID=2672568 RepID=UPI0013DC9400|nr:2-amino-4-hydroxy-6-hydroxymethyldihydropteridine diphosphokinase [Sandarakinorhabdus rubra]